MANSKKIIVDVSIEEKGRSIAEIERDIRQLIKQYKDLAEVARKGAEGADLLSKVTATRGELKDASQQLNQTLERERKSLGGINEGAKFAENSLGELEQAQKRLKSSILRNPIDSPETAEFAKELQDVNTKIKVFKDTLKPTTKETVSFDKAMKNATDALNKQDVTVDELTKSYKQLKAATNGVAMNTQEFADASQKLGELQNKIKPNKGGSFFKDLFTTILDPKNLTAVGAITAAVTILIQAFSALTQAVEESIKTRREVALLTNLEGESLTKVAGQIEGLSKVYNKSTEEILQSGKNFASEFGLSYEEAFNLIEKGFALGADANGEFTQSLREYSAQLKSVGATAEESIVILTQLNTSGFYSDKAIDAIKEAGLSLREQTKATEDALINAFGATYTQELFNRINTGKTTLLDATKEVAKKMQETQLTAQQVGTLFADVFKGAGEDAGERLLPILTQLGDKLSDIKVDDVRKQFGELAASQIELQQALQRLSGELDGSQSQWEIFKNETLADLINILNELMPIFRVIGTYIAEFWKDRINDIKTFISALSTTFDSIKNFKDQLMRFFNIFSGGIGSMFTATKKTYDKYTNETKKATKDMKDANEKANKEKQKAAETAAKIDKEAAKKAADEYKKLQDEIKKLRDKATESLASRLDKDLGLIKYKYKQDLNEYKQSQAFKSLTLQEQLTLQLDLLDKYYNDLLNKQRENSDKVTKELEDNYNKQLKLQRDFTNEIISQREDQITDELRAGEMILENDELNQWRLTKSNKEFREKNAIITQAYDDIEQNKAEANKARLILIANERERELINIKSRSLEEEKTIITQQFDGLNKDAEQNYNARIDLLNEQLKKELEITTDPQLRETINKKYEEQLKIERDYYNKRLDLIADTYNKELKTINDNQKQLQQTNDELRKKEIEALKTINEEYSEIEKQQKLYVARLLQTKEKLDAFGNDFTKVGDTVTSVYDVINQAAIDSANQQIEQSQRVIDEANNRISQIEELEKNATGKRKQLLKQELDENKKRVEQNQKNIEAAQKKAIEAERRAANIKKAFTLAKIAIDTASAIMAAIAANPATVGLPQSAIIAAQGIAQAAVVSSQKFARGGIVTGKSHAQGGIPAIANNSLIEIEGDEIILTKGVARNPLKRAIASYLNQSEGGVAFAKGGIPKTTNINMPNIMQDNTISEQILNELQLLRNDYKTISPVVSVEDINKVQTKVQNVKVINQL